MNGEYWRWVEGETSAWEQLLMRCPLRCWLSGQAWDSWQSLGQKYFEFWGFVPILVEM